MKSTQQIHNALLLDGIRIVGYGAMTVTGTLLMVLTYGTTLAVAYCGSGQVVMLIMGLVAFLISMVFTTRCFLATWRLIDSLDRVVVWVAGPGPEASKPDEVTS